MPKVYFTQVLKRFYPALEAVEIGHTCIRDIVMALEDKYPGITHFLLDDQGELRTHVNIFVGEAPIKDRQGLSDVCQADDDLYIMQALSGG